LIGGARGMTGAICLAGMACLRSGAGLVKLAVPESSLEIVARFEPSYMTAPLMSDSLGCIFAAAEAQLRPLVADATCVAIGPGLSRSGELTQLVRSLYTSVTQPMVVDADALNALASLPDGLSQPGGPRVITPHPGEFARLAKTPEGRHISREAQTIQAREMAAAHGIVVVLKGHETLVTDGQRHYLNRTGNPGMATGGCGDVLTGILTGLICQGLTPLDAAVLGTHVHGLAGDLAAGDLGQISLIASDLMNYLPEAFQSLD
jgi:NAD(P)H-hydrate epimerase